MDEKIYGPIHASARRSVHSGYREIISYTAIWKLLKLPKERSMFYWNNKVTDIVILISKPHSGAGTFFCLLQFV
ncbi:MAG: hypothetical protein COT71_02575 [Candidatus Andersenbacteria bacterium CG10_big_fil_rev_8_21_14_0_10_54_11]|uniref:Uncharacterized protein n=1 Tax=Candidatus Andersenbacteria bacterium CG10_big_fil_rev_8_21_14_0_10_54_11 TaxID=1974485 RepID=A0A2M6WZ60_9BACT|nr:MAG: hypothetical protein COT71_02575 [Candidatus Andersenbacteria bacterium CG10_big_fil_rev_8_21_14_0_10_54_11]